MDFNSALSLTMRYLWGPTGIVARQTSGETVSWYLADALGSVRDLINNSGAIIDHIDFSAFGTVLDQSDPSAGDRMMGFAGMEQDSVTRLNLAVYREENPGTGRWDSQDPLGFRAGDGNLYRYLGNAPNGGDDPSGEDWLDSYASWFPDLGVGQNILYPLLKPIVGNNNLAGASATQLAAGTAITVIVVVVGAELICVGVTGTSIGAVLGGGLNVGISGGTLSAGGEVCGTIAAEGSNTVVTIVHTLRTPLMVVVKALRARGFTNIVIRTGPTTRKVQRVLQFCARNGRRFPLGRNGGTVTELSRWPWFIIEF